MSCRVGGGGVVGGGGWGGGWGGCGGGGAGCTEDTDCTGAENKCCDGECIQPSIPGYCPSLCEGCNQGIFYSGRIKITFEGKEFIWGQSNIYNTVTAASEEWWSYDAQGDNFMYEKYTGAATSQIKYVALECFNEPVNNEVRWKASLQSYCTADDGDASIIETGYFPRCQKSQCNNQGGILGIPLGSPVNIAAEPGWPSQTGNGCATPRASITLTENCPP